MKKKIMAGIAVILLITALIMVYYNNRPDVVEGEKTIVVTVEHLQGDKITKSYRTDAEYLREALEDNHLISGREAEYGLWVDTVDGERADETQQQWWGYTVNGEMAVYGVDEQPVKDGDAYVFTLHTGY